MLTKNELPAHGVNLQEILAEVREHARGMWRYRWWALAVAWAFSLIGSVFVFAVPDIYLASAKVFVDTNGLLKPLMQGLTATSNPLNEVNVVSRAVLTRPNLEAVADKTDLSLRAHTPQQLEELVTRLQEQIQVSGGHENIFTIQYQDVSREKAREVVAAVLDTFVESALGNEGDDAELTEKALANEINVHETRLREAEAALGRFKQDNLGYVPGETGDYYKNLQTAIAKVAATEENVRLLVETRNELQRQESGDEPVFLGLTTGTVADVGLRCSQSRLLAQDEAQLATLRSAGNLDKHPRIVSLQEQIAQLEAECHAEMEAAGATRGLASPEPGQRVEVNPVYQNIRIQLTNAEVALVAARARLTAEQADVARLRRDVDKITEVEIELKQLNRDYSVVQTRHQELLKRWEDLQAKKRLDPVTDNVQFRRIEPPFAQAAPIGPNRPLLLAGVLALALAAGGALAFALNQFNPTFFTLTSLQRAVSIPVLGAISVILPRAVIAKQRLDRLVWVFGVVMLLASTAVAVQLAPHASALLHGLVAGARA
jgi:polysaccharide chain length determinant protein (PEP-CTERM system associated)